MKEHLQHALHNESFLSVIEAHSPNNFFDWKLIVTFYSALHYLRALEHHKKAHIGGKHKDLFLHIDNKNTTAKMPVPKTVYDAYSELFNMAHSSRYTRVNDITQFQLLMKHNLNLAKGHLTVIKAYVTAQGVK